MRVSGPFEFFFWLLMSSSRLVVWPITRLLSIFRGRVLLPPIGNDLLKTSASQLAWKIRHREVTSFEVVQAFVKRICDVREILNCVIEDRFKEALREAAEVDRMLEENPDPSHWAKHKPLLGVPITVKESIAVQGMSWNAGIKCPKPQTATKNATCVEQVKEAGGIVLLVSSTPELCMSYETFNRVQGTCRNPYDTRRTTGGSSGGEAALLGSGSSVIGIGSDTAGSSRVPALFCGVFGHKPSPGAVPFEGHRPTTNDKIFAKIFSMAPMCRYAEDLPLIMGIMADQSMKARLKLDQPVDLAKVKIYYMESDGCLVSNKVHKEVKQSLRKALKHFEVKFGVQPQLVQIDLTRVWISCIILMTRVTELETAYSKSASSPDEWNSVFKEMLKFCCCCSSHTFPALLYAPLKTVGDFKAKKELEGVMEYLKSLISILENLLKDDGVLFFPMFYDLANFHYQFYYKLLNTTYCTLSNLTELPATAVPMGLAKDGRPLGIQILTNKFEERLSFAVAKELELAFGGWRPPPSTSPSIEIV